MPDGVLEPFVCDQLPEFVETAPDGLLPVGDDCDLSCWYWNSGVQWNPTYPMAGSFLCPAFQGVDHDRADIDPV